VIIRSISARNVLGTREAYTLDLDDDYNVIEAEGEFVPAVPSMVSSLLYPDEASSTELARIAGSSPEANWRLVIEIGRRRIRLARGFDPESATMEIFEEPQGPWNPVARGAADVKAQLGRICELPDSNLLDPLAFSIGTGRRPVRRSRSADDNQSKMALMSSEDYFGGAFAEDNLPSARPTLSREARQKLGEAYRQARTAKGIDEQVKALKLRLQAVIDKMGGLVDDGGDLARVEKVLSEIPPMRALTDDEREVFANPDERVADLERRMLQIDEEIERIGKHNPAGLRAVLSNVPLVAGVSLALLLTVWSVFGGYGARKIAMGNVLVLLVGLLGAFRHIALLEGHGAVERKGETLQRRRAATEVQLEQTRRTAELIRRDLRVKSLEEYDRLFEKRARAEKIKAEFARQHGSVMSSQSYRELQAEREQVEKELALRERARQRAGTVSAQADELAAQLEAAGVDANACLWRPEEEVAELSTALKRLAAVALEYRLLAEDGLKATVLEPWQKLTAHLLGDKSETFALSGEGKLLVNGDPRALDEIPVARSAAVVEALRCSLHMALIAGLAPGIQKWMIRVHPYRLDDPIIATTMKSFHESVGRRMQVIVLLDEND
jgi:hypothetical protein